MPRQSIPTIQRIFRTLHDAWGAQHWWPAETAFEVVVGAFLTQNTAWTNVELAMANLRAADALSVEAIRALPLDQLETIVRPAGFFRQKAARLKAFVEHLDRHYSGSLENMFQRPTNALREELLAMNGVGPETADSILLYAATHAVFVVDAYTRRIFLRHELIGEKTTYEEIRSAVEEALVELPEAEAKGCVPATQTTPAKHSPSAMSLRERSELSQRYNEFHALIVQVGKHYCHRKEALCTECPLRPLLPGTPG